MKGKKYHSFLFWQCWLVTSEESPAFRAWLHIFSPHLARCCKQPAQPCSSAKHPETALGLLLLLVLSRSCEFLHLETTDGFPRDAQKLHVEAP